MVRPQEAGLLGQALQGLPFHLGAERRLRGDLRLQRRLVQRRVLGRQAAGVVLQLLLSAGRRGAPRLLLGSAGVGDEVDRTQEGLVLPALRTRLPARDHHRDADAQAAAAHRDDARRGLRVGRPYLGAEVGPAEAALLLQPHRRRLRQASARRRVQLRHRRQWRVDVAGGPAALVLQEQRCRMRAARRAPHDARADALRLRGGHRKVAGLGQGETGLVLQARG
mmetsp:Transcript_5212/g.15009  ORF Transcript_5212/g.15009 Transcript_5212/m.15009 type:complete len:223 (-) Transcript_5212:281-949(-)